MTPEKIDRGTVQSRLRHLQDTLDTLGRLSESRAEKPHDDVVIRAAVERLLQVVVEAMGMALRIYPDYLTAIARSVQTSR